MLKSESFLPNLSRLSFPTRGLGWLANQRNPSGYWQVTKGDLSQIISFLHARGGGALPYETDGDARRKF